MCEGVSVIEIDGAQGGGQILRSSLTLSLVTGRAVQIKNIRATRPKPGLLRQHLTCVKAAEAICGARVTGAEMGSSEVTFQPGAVRAGDYQFAIGSAGSTCLVFQTLFLPLALAEEGSTLHFTGGTHNGLSPSFDYIDQCFLPVVRRMGFCATLNFERYGFYPAGGGAWSARIDASMAKEKLELLQRGAVQNQWAVALSSRIPAHVNERELAQVQKKLFWPEASLHRRSVPSAGPGNMVSLSVECEQVTERIEVVGEKRLSAERVAGRAIKAMKTYLATDAPVGEHLADQLLLPMALGAGGCFRTLAPSQHLLSNAAVIQAFLPVDIQTQAQGDGVWRVVVQ